MKVLLLSPYPERLQPVFAAYGDVVDITDQRLDDSALRARSYDWVVSYGYRYIMRGLALETFRNRIVNLHVSYLPWNGGADPNFWSFFDDTPKGVTLHWIDAGVDTGDLIAQSRLNFGDGETLATSYAQLQTAVEELFAANWPVIRAGAAPRIPQTGTGSKHLAKDKAQHLHALSLGWDTPVANVVEIGRQHREIQDKS